MLSNLRTMSAAVILCALIACAHATCGTRGGPGYRKPRGSLRRLGGHGQDLRLSAEHALHAGTSCAGRGRGGQTWLQDRRAAARPAARPVGSLEAMIMTTTRTLIALTAKALAALAIGTAPAMAADKSDVVGIFAVLSTYITTCVAKEDPPPLEKMVAVAHAARIAGIDITSPAFKREVAKRVENLTATAPLIGTRRWCEITERQVEADYEMLKAAGK
jgi:hypothetical protein